MAPVIHYQPTPSNGKNLAVVIPLAINVASNVGVAVKSEVVITNADAGTVTVIVSSAVIS